MSNSTNAILQNAFDLIENNKLNDAQNLLEPLLETDSNNPAVWWVYAHALQDPEEGMKAIDKVVQLDPTYPGASELKSQMSSTKIPMSESDDAVDNWDDLAFTSDTEKTDSITNGRSPIRFLFIAIIVIIIVVGIFAVLSGALSDTSQQPTQVAGQSTLIPTANIQIVTNVSATEMSTEVATEITPTQEVATVLPTDKPTEVEPTTIPTIAPTQTPSYLSILVENLSTYGVSEADLATRQTLLGTTLDVTVCASPGAEFSLALNGVMAILVEFNSDAPEDVTAFAVTLIDCNNEQSVPRTIGVERSFVQSFSDEEIALKDFQREWKPLP
jgi:hypothetical protein